MIEAPSLEQQVDALDRGVGLLDLEGWILVEVRGDDAERWLNDLVTANVAAPAPGQTLRSLLLGPTGRIRADILVHRRLDAFLLLQGAGQPVPIDRLLEPYVLSSRVELAPPRSTPAVRPARSGPWSVSDAPVLGVAVGPEAFESWRIRCGAPRFPVDLDEDSLPAEAGLDDVPVVDPNKGCYLGQESVAKVRNRGHPTRVVVPVTAKEPVEQGAEVIGGEGPVGRLTSVDALGGGLHAIARIRWEARDADLMTTAGVPLTHD